MNLPLLLLPLIATSSGEHASAASKPPATPATEISVLSYNVLYDATEIDKSIDVAEETRPDIVCLRELTPSFAKRFESRLAKAYPYRALRPVKGTWGVGIASRFPLSQVQKFEEQPHKIPGMDAFVAVDGKRVRLACLHLFPPVGKHRKSDGFFETMEKNAELRRKQAEHLVTRYSAREVPTLLLGDMNEEATGKAIAAFEKAGFIRSCRCPNSSCGSTWPGATTAVPAVLEIDHILGRGVTFTSAKRIRGGGSDHYPVYATFTIP